MLNEKQKKVLCPIERKDRSTYWMNVGNAFINSDGSTNVYLNALPQNGRLQIRDLDERDLERMSNRKPSNDSGGDQAPF